MYNIALWVESKPAFLLHKFQVLFLTLYLDSTNVQSNKKIKVISRVSMLNSYSDGNHLNTSQDKTLLSGTVNMLLAPAE